MDPLALLGRLLGRRRPPLTLKDMAERAPRLGEYFERLKGKRVLVFNPPFWGFHDIFVDREGGVLLVALKAEGDSFAFIGDERGASLMLKYGPGPVLNAEEDLAPGLLEWILYDDFVVYRGPFFPMSRDPYHLGRVAALADFDGEAVREAVPAEITRLREWYRKRKQ